MVLAEDKHCQDAEQRRSLKIRNAGYLLNPFELEAYGRMYDPDYLKKCNGMAEEWRKYARMSLKERARLLRR